MLRSLIIAFSMYSKIPMPKVEWKEKSMNYCLVFFPLIGVVTGLSQLLCYFVMGRLQFGKAAVAAILTALPVLISGGIHMDGFLDTVDARSSWKSQSERLEILKDPHTGAFAIIYGILYFLAAFGLYTEITWEELAILSVGYVFERVLAGLSLVTLKKARKDGMAAGAADAASGNVKWVLVLEGLLCAAAFIRLDPAYGVLAVLAGGLCFVNYRHVAYKYFGGITGDLAGYFLQTCELFMLLVLVAGAKLIG